MKAIVQTGYGQPEQVLRLEEVERPPVGPTRRRPRSSRSLPGSPSRRLLRR
jgi:hypothetical protein